MNYTEENICETLETNSDLLEAKHTKGGRRVRYTSLTICRLFFLMNTNSPVALFHPQQVLLKCTNDDTIEK